MRRTLPVVLCLLLACLGLCLPLCRCCHASPPPARPSSVSRWSVSDVQEWLSSLGLSEHAPAVGAELIDGVALLELSADEWRTQLGVGKLGHRKRIQRAVRMLREEEEAAAVTETMRTSAGDTPAASIPAVSPPAALSSAVPRPVPVEPPVTETEVAPPPSAENSAEKASPRTSAAAASKSKPAQKKKPKASTGVSPTGFASALSPEAASALIASFASVPLPTARVLTPALESSVAQWMREALSAHQNARYALARELYERVLEAQPAHGRALHHLGLIDLQNELPGVQGGAAAASSSSSAPSRSGDLGPNLSRALRLLHQSLALSPQEADTFVNLGSLYAARASALQERAEAGGGQTGWQAESTKAIVAWKRALDLSPLAGGVALRARFAELLYAEALRVHGLGELQVCEEYLLYVTTLCAEGAYMHFPAEWSPPMSQRVLDEYERQKKGASAATKLGGGAPISPTSPAPLQLLSSNSELTHSLRMLLADAWLHLGMLAESSTPPSMPLRALSLAFFRRTLAVFPTSLDAQKPEATRIATIRAEALQAVQRVENQLARLGPGERDRFKELVRWSQEWIRQHQLDTGGAAATLSSRMMTSSADEAPRPLVLPRPSSTRSRNKKLVDHLSKSCLPHRSFELALLNGDDAAFHSPRWGMLYSSEAELLQTRANFSARLDALLADPRMEGKWATGAGLEWNRFRFYLAYHGLSNKELMEKMAAVYLRAAPILRYTATHLLVDPTNGMRERLLNPPSPREEGLAASILSRFSSSASTSPSSSSDRRIRVGFISAFLHQHPVGKTLAGYMLHLPADRFHLFAYSISLHAPDRSDPLLPLFRARVERGELAWRELEPESWPRARAVIESDRVDVLIYGDLSMEATSYFLAFSRLAPIQAVTFGHPDTSGLGETMDYFLSHEEMEVSDAQEAQRFYSEKLVRLPGAGYWLPPFVPPVTRGREHFGLSDTQLAASGVVFPDASSPSPTPTPRPLFLVSKSVQFYSPRFMDALARILHRLPQSVLVLLMDTGKSRGGGGGGGGEWHNACIDQIQGGIEERLRKMNQRDDEAKEGKEDVSAERAEKRNTRQSNPASSATPRSDDVLASLLSSSAAPTPGPAVSGRVRLVDRGDHAYFMSLLQSVDVLLQPFPLDGTTTTLEGVATATPTVIRRGTTVGGRMGWALFNHMRFTDLCASSDAEYVEIAVRLGGDPRQREQVRGTLREIAGTKGRIFEDPRAIDAYATWIERAVADKLKVAEHEETNKEEL